MFNHICHSINYEWEEANRSISHFIDTSIDQVVTNILPSQIATVIQDDYKIEARIMALWMLNTSLLIATVCNPWVPTWIGATLGIITVIPTARILSINCKAHLNTCSKELTAHECKLQAILPIILVALEVIGLYIERSRSPQILMGSVLVFSNFSVFLSIIANGLVIHNKREAKKIMKALEGECIILTKKIEALKEIVENFDNFIRERPDLYKLIVSQLTPEDFRDYSKISAYSGDNEIINRRTHLSIELTRREYFWQKRVSYIKNYPEIYECFCAHLSNSDLDIKNLIK